MTARKEIEPIGVTLDRFIKSRQDDFPGVSGEFSQMLRDIALAGKVINREMNHFGLLDIQGGYGSKNVQGEDQQKLDVIANYRFIQALSKGGEVCAVLSEEEEEVIELDRSKKYIVAMDPLDGSSNIDVTVSVGTIFSIYRRITQPGNAISDADILQKGVYQVAAGYIIYGSSTMLVYTTGAGVNGFTLEPSLGEFFLSHPDLKISQQGSTYSVNEGLFSKYSEDVRSYIKYCKDNELKARYTGSLVTDFHRNLLKGGIYFYPAYEGAENGKLRLLYECNPMAYICEQAGGKASDGRKRILEIDPEGPHQRAPLYIGSTDMVDQVESFIKE